MVEWETGLFWLVAAMLAAFAVAPADTQYARFAPAADRLMETSLVTSLRSDVADYWNTGPPVAAACLSA
jgi:hypothetical protein